MTSDLHSFPVFAHHKVIVVVFLFQKASVSSSSSSSSSKDTNSHKDDGVFKAPPPPPKVIKSVTIPTEPYQDIVTALKCRKEHKEVSTALWEMMLMILFEICPLKSVLF